MSQLGEEADEDEELEEEEEDKKQEGEGREGGHVLLIYIYICVHIYHNIFSGEVNQSMPRKCFCGRNSCD